MQRRLLSNCDIESEKENADDVVDTLLDCQPEQVGSPWVSNSALSFSHTYAGCQAVKILTIHI